MERSHYLQYQDKLNVNDSPVRILLKNSHYARDKKILTLLKLKFINVEFLGSSFGREKWREIAINDDNIKPKDIMIELTPYRDIIVVVDYLRNYKKTPIILIYNSTD